MFFAAFSGYELIFISFTLLISQRKKNMVYNIVNLITAVLECLCFSGVFVGWPAAQFMFEEEGYFNQSCGTKTNQSSSGRCDEQDQFLSLVVVVGTSAMFVCSYFMGYIYDR